MSTGLNSVRKKRLFGTFKTFKNPWHLTNTISVLVFFLPHKCKCLILPKFPLLLYNLVKLVRRMPLYLRIKASDETIFFLEIYRDCYTFLWFQKVFPSLTHIISFFSFPLNSYWVKEKLFKIVFFFILVQDLRLNIKKNTS